MSISDRKKLKEELSEKYRYWISELEKAEGKEGWDKYKDEMKTKYPLGYERHSFEEGLKELSGWYFWHGRNVESLEGFKVFVGEGLNLIYSGFQNTEYYKDFGLEGFLLKMRQGEAFNIDNNMLFSVPVSENIKGIYRKVYERSYDKMEADLIGLLDCRDNKFIVKHYDFDKFKKLLPDYTDEYKQNTPESRRMAREKYGVVFMSDMFDEVNELICRFKSDRFCESVENRKLIVKTLPLDFEAEYDDIQKLAMGFNNHICLSFKRLEDKELYEHTLGYLEGDLDYLRDLVYKDKEIARTDLYNKYLGLVKSYSNIKENADKLIEGEIKSAIEGKASVYVNDKQYKEVYCYISSSENTGVIRSKHDYKGTLLSEVETLKYGRKEIFNRKEAVERLSSSEFQAGINGLIVFVRNHFNRYDSKGVDISKIKDGDLVYTKSRHFGIVNKGKINLDNGRQESLEQAVISIKEEEELNKGLRVMRDYIKDGKEKEAENER